MNETPGNQDAPNVELRWCRNVVHRIPATFDRCSPCLRQSKYRRIARDTRAPFCRAGHGLVRHNVGLGPGCVECDAFTALIADPATPIRPAPSTWLDWAAVLQAFDGRPLTRPLSQREIACLVATIQDGRPDWILREIAEWLDSSTYVKDVTVGYIQWLHGQWWQRQGFPDPRITLGRAVFAEADGEVWIAQARKAKSAAEAALAETA